MLCMSSLSCVSSVLCVGDGLAVYEYSHRLTGAPSTPTIISLLEMCDYMVLS